MQPFVNASRHVPGALLGVQADGAFELRMPSLGRVWSGPDPETAFKAMTADAMEPDVAMGIGQAELFELLEGTTEHPLSSPQNMAAGIATLRSVPALEPGDLSVLSGPDPVLVDVWGPRCTSCVLMAPVVAELERSLRGRVRVLQVDGEADVEFRHRLEVYALPTYLLYRAGERLAYLVGFRGVTAFLEQIEAALGEPAA